MPSQHRTPNRRRLHRGLALLAPLGLLACSASQNADVPMQHACQFKACVCTEADAPLLVAGEEVEVQWREDNGDAYCPEGYKLAFDD